MVFVLILNTKGFGMSRYFSVIDLSENISETPEGYLICRDAAIARAGDLLYSPTETDVESDGTPTVITRSIEDLCTSKTIASFEGKPVTIGHPDGGGQFVGPENWQDFAVGIVQNVRQGDGDDVDKLIADLLITDLEAISVVKRKSLRQLSCGYDAKFIETDKNKGIQKNIVGNHVALVQAGRCGSECSIFDSAPTFLEEQKNMSVKDKVMRAFGKAFDEAMPDDKGTPPDADSTKDADSVDLVTTLKGLISRIEALEGKVSNSDKESDKKEAQDEGPAPDDMTVDEDNGEDDRLSKMEAMLLQLVQKLMPQDDDKEELVEDKTQYEDSETISRAEILAPGIEATKDIKINALGIAYKTETGKKAIDSILSGRSFDEADKDLLFAASAEVLKSMRREKMNSTSVMDSMNINKKECSSPKSLNEFYTDYYTNKQ